MFALSREYRAPICQLPPQIPIKSGVPELDPGILVWNTLTAASAGGPNLTLLASELFPLVLEGGLCQGLEERGSVPSSDSCLLPLLMDQSAVCTR